MLTKDDFEYLLVSSMSALVILAIGFVMMFLIIGILNLIKKWRDN